MPAHSPPPTAPARMTTVSTAGLGQPAGRASAVAVAARMPMSIWPSAPMLMMPLRKAMAMPSPTRVSGTARTRISVMPNMSWNGPVKIVT